MFGFIERIREARQEGGETVWTLTISGREYEASDPALVRDLHSGDAVSFLYLQEGQQRRIMQLRKLPRHDAPSGNWSRGTDERGERIARMSCLKTAAQILESKRLEPTRKAQLVVEIARRLERYVLGDRPAVPRRKVKP